MRNIVSACTAGSVRRRLLEGSGTGLSEAASVLMPRLRRRLQGSYVRTSPLAQQRDMATAVQVRPAHTSPPAVDWIAALTSNGPDRDRATAQLHELLLRAARFEVGRRRPELWARPGEVDELASQAATDAL